MEKSWFEYISTQRDMDDYRKRIKEFSLYSQEEKEKIYRKGNFGVIVQSYPKKFEEFIYRKVANLIARKYSDIISEEEIYDILNSAGCIYTMDVSPLHGHGFYHYNSADVGVKSYLNKISPELVHELIHRLGALRFNPGFYDMDSIYKDAGTELVTNVSLEAVECKECIVRGSWVKSYGPDAEYLTQVSLVNLINLGMGGNTLERSVLQGNNCFQRKMLEMFGKEESISITNRIKEILSLEKEYWNYYIKHGNDEFRERKIGSRIQLLQDDIMEKCFDKRFDKVESKEEAMQLLKELITFLDHRIKIKEVDGDNVRFVDYSGNTYFTLKKLEVMKRFKFDSDLFYAGDLWSDRYPVQYVRNVDRVKKNKEIKDIKNKAKLKTKKRFISIIARSNSQVGNASLLNSGNEFDDWIQKMQLKCDFSDIMTIDIEKKSADRTKEDIKE